MGRMDMEEGKIEASSYGMGRSQEGGGIAWGI